MSDVYFRPEQYGLEPIAEINYTDDVYGFDIRAVWRTEDGRLVTARDAGCSCPSPFEDYHSVADLKDVNYQALRDEAHQEMKSEWHFVPSADVDNFLSKVRAALK